MGYDTFSKQNPRMQYSMWIWRLCYYMLVYVHCQTNMSEAGHASVLWKKLDSAPSRGHKGVLNRCFFACALLVCCFSFSLFFTRTCAINQLTSFQPWNLLENSLIKYTKLPLASVNPGLPTTFTLKHVYANLWLAICAGESIKSFYGPHIQQRM